MTNPGLKTLFLRAPSFGGFDGGAGSRYQAKREVRSFWYPTWLAQAAALVPRSRLLEQDNPRVLIGLVGAKTMVDPDGSLRATAAVDFVCREEFDYACQEVATGVDLGQIVREMLVTLQMMRRRLRAGVEFCRFLRAREA